MNENQPAQNSPEKIASNAGERPCSVDRCETGAIIVLGEKTLCLQHFISRCYEWLDQLDPAARNKLNDAADSARIKMLVEECSNRALLVSLRCETLTNLDRSRLLDILSRSSDLLFLLCIPPSDLVWLPAYPADPLGPPVKKLSLGSQLLSSAMHGS
jgi:hypothetical protein